jgi:hypothetical protein
VNILPAPSQWGPQLVVSWTITEGPQSSSSGAQQLALACHVDAAFCMMLTGILEEVDAVLGATAGVVLFCEPWQG